MKTEDDTKLVQMLLPKVHSYYRWFIVAWLRAHEQRVNASNIKTMYRYIIGQLTYIEVIQYFDLPLSASLEVMKLI